MIGSGVNKTTATGIRSDGTYDHRRHSRSAEDGTNVLLRRIRTGNTHNKMETRIQGQVAYAINVVMTHMMTSRNVEHVVLGALDARRLGTMYDNAGHWVQIDSVGEDAFPHAKIIDGHAQL